VCLLSEPRHEFLHYLLKNDQLTIQHFAHQIEKIVDKMLGDMIFLGCTPSDVAPQVQEKLMSNTSSYFEVQAWSEATLKNLRISL
jgi:hypothetical protein